MTIRIGTDCSGIEAPIEALKQLGIPFEHKWACEIDKFARKSILANYKPEILYEDITKRDHAQLPDVDLYVCGFPCQSFSLMGKKKGMLDSRGDIMLHCIEVIKIKRPHIFILENVKNFKYIDDGKAFKFLIDSLLNITENNQTIYNVSCDVYNTKSYGVPQNRERLYIVGILIDVSIQDYKKPPQITMTPLKDILIDHQIYPITTTYQNILTNLQKLANKTTNLSIVTADKYYYPLLDCSPTLTTKCGYFYISTYNRRLYPNECLLLQGFSSGFKQVVSDSQMYKQAGNTMSVNVLKAILTQIIHVTIIKYILPENNLTLISVGLLHLSG